MNAQNTRSVLDAVVLASGVGGVVKTGAQILVKEGFKQLAKAAAKGLVTKVAEGAASQTANAIGGYLLNVLGVEQDNAYLQSLKLGVDAYQSFSLLKKVRPKCTNGSCFAAGTNVITGFNDDGSLITTPIELIQEGDYVLSRDQHDPNDDLDPQRVTSIFRRTSDHLRIVTIAGDDGNIEAIKTTDEHPFYVQNKGWTSAGSLQAGDLVQEADGSWQAVLASARESHPNGITVYNLEVEGDHTYFVEDGFGGVDGAIRRIDTTYNT